MISDVLRITSLFLSQILETLLSLGIQIKTCSEGFQDMRERLGQVETSLTTNMQDLQTQYEVRAGKIATKTTLFSRRE